MTDQGEIIGPRGPRTTFLDARGYPRVTIYRNGKWSQHFAHVIVCEAWHGPRPDGMEVAHRDNVKTNIHPNNLRWATHAENEADKIEHGTTLRGDRHHQAKLSADQVREIRLRRAAGEMGISLAQLFGVTPQTVSRIVTGKNWGHLS